MYQRSLNEYRPRGISGIRTCDVSGSSESFRLANKVAVYPGRENNWLVAKSSKGSGTIEDFVRTFIQKPFSTSLIGNNVLFVVQRIGESAEDARLAMQATGLRVQANAAGGSLGLKDQNPAVKMGASPVEFFKVIFYIPEDFRGTTTPWPVVGCVEEADWTLSAATSDIQVVNGKQVPLASELLAGKGAASASESSDARTAAIARLKMLTAQRTSSDLLSNKWVWAGGVAALAAIALLWRARAHR